MSHEIEEDIRPKHDIKLQKKFDHHVVYINYCDGLVSDSYEEAINSED